VHFLEDDLIIYVTGNKYQTYNLDTKEIKTYEGYDTDGIGSITVHKSRRYFAVAEKGLYPNIYIRQNPGYKIYRILRKGTELSYAHVEFSASGDKLVSLGGKPDYTLTVWDWRKERVILKCRAFGAEVFKASFSPFTDDVLFTGGSGHIRFWKMAQTFTGLKLQGEIAKYGQLELSDASGWQELPDGKILSGTEYGTMILWEGNLVKAHLVLDRESKATLHKGCIETIILDNDMIISAAADGYLKWWSLAEIDAAEADEILEIGIQPLKEVQILTEQNDPAHILNVVRGNGLWLISDQKGRLWRVNPEDFSAKIIFEYQSGEFTDMAMSDAYNMAVTCGEDGMVKVWDYTRAEAYYSHKFEGKANTIDIMRRSEQNKGRVLACGFESGLVRILELSDSNIELAMVMKAHDGPVDFVRYAPDQMTLVTASRNGEIFFFDINGHMELGKCNPICLLVLNDCKQINDLKWDAKSEHILVATEAGYVHEIPRPDPTKLDVSDSYLIADYPMRTWKMKMMEFQMKKNQKKDEEEEEKKRRARLRGELKNEDNEEEEDWDPEGISAVCYNESEDPANNIIVGCKGQYRGFYYLANLDQPRPTKAIAMHPDLLLKQLTFNQTGEILVQTFSDSEIRMLNINFPDRFMQIKQHDAHALGTAAVKFSYDERCLLSAGKDGILMVHTLDKYMVTQESQFNPLDGVAGIDFMPESQVAEVYKERTDAFHQANEANIPEFDPTVDGLDETLFSVSLRGFPEMCEDILDTSVYSIQQAKLRTEEDHRLKLAEEKKQGVRRKIDNLRQEFDVLHKLNEGQEDVIRIGSDDFNIDPEYFEMLLDRNANKIEETKKEVAYNIEWSTVALNKLKNKFYDVLDFEKYTVKAMRTWSYVTTFRVPKMSDFLNKNIEQFRSLIASEVAAKEHYEGDSDEGLEDEKVEIQKQKTEIKKPAAASNVHKTDAEKKREERKIQREIRKKKIEKLVKKEAMIQQNEDPDRNPQIMEAKATFGMFNLKMSPDYEVPENMQINATKKRQQMVLLEGSIHKLKVDFNNKILDLKHKKTAIISQVEQMNGRIAQINGVLGVKEDLFLPQIDEKSEYPQKFFNVTDPDIDAFRIQKQKEAEALAAAAKGAKGKRSKAQQQADAEEEEANKKAEAEAAAAVKKEDKPKLKPTHNNANPYLNAVPTRKGHKKMETELDEEYDQIMRIELQYEKNQLKSESESLVNDFDGEIKEMQKEKYRLESDLKNAEIKLILLFEELILLNSMEAKDKELTAQLTSNRQEKGHIMKDITDITKKLREKKREIDGIKSEEENLLAKFHDHCPEGGPKYNEIRRFYERITKKRRKVEKEVKEEADEDDEEGEAEQEEEDEQEAEDEDEDPAIAGLSSEDFKIDEIEKLRDERLQLYDAKEKIGMFITDLELQRKKMETKEKNCNLELGETEEEIRDFQKEKMAKLN
jgi:WD40 repeat protein